MRTLRYLEAHGSNSCRKWLPSLYLGECGKIIRTQEPHRIGVQNSVQGVPSRSQRRGGVLEMRQCPLYNTVREGEKPVLGCQKKIETSTNCYCQDYLLLLGPWCQELQANREFLPLPPASQLCFCALYWHDFTGNKQTKEE